MQALTLIIDPKSLPFYPLIKIYYRLHKHLLNSNAFSQFHPTNKIKRIIEYE
jgi:hypothetical protein